LSNSVVTEKNTVRCVIMEQDSHIDNLNSGKYIVGETSYLEGYSGLNREPVYVTSQGCLLKI